MKRNTTYYFSIAVLFVLLFSCNENRIGEDETGVIRGQVVANGTNIPQANARISTDPITSTVFTDSLGNFKIENVPVGDYAVEARKDGFVTDFQPTTVIGNVAVNVVFELVADEANNRPPDAPVLTAPTDGELLQSVEANFQWTGSDPENDPLTYTIELRNDQNSDVQMFTDITETSFSYSPLLLGAQYFWQVTADDGINDPVISSVSSFDVITAPVDNRFLFVRNINGNNVIFSADESGNEFQLTSSELNSYRPRRNVSADRIAYFQTTGGQIDIFTMKRDGSDIQQVTSTQKPNGFNLNEINFSWPATSDMIYFPSFDKLYRINTNGQGLELVYETPDGSFISQVDVSENADLIALKTNDQNGYSINIFTINFAGVIQDVILTGVPGAAGGLNLSVTNQTVVYAYDVSGFESPDYRRLDSRIFVYDFGAMTTTDISDNKPNGTNDLEPIFSPNEAFVTFTNTSNDGISQRDVYQLEIGQGNTRTLLFSDAFMPDWE